MSESSFRSWPSRAAAGTFEGNVHMPQVFFGIQVYGADKCLESEHPDEEVGSLLNPIPLDTVLTERTEKANAQHDFWNIGVQLKPGDVRDIQVHGNRKTLELIANLLGIDATALEDEELDPITDFDTEGSWATEADREVVARVQPYLRQTEYVSALRTIVRLLRDLFKSPEVVSILNARKELFRDWKTRQQLDRAKTSELINTKVDEVHVLTRIALRDASNSENFTELERTLARQLLAKL